MSVDLAVWEGASPASDEEARAAFDDLCKRFLDSPPIPASNKIADYVGALLGRYADLTTADDDEADVPWASGPLLGNASGPIVYIGMKLNDVLEDGWRFCVETAESHGLVAFDPQSGTLANPDATVSPAASEPGDARSGGPVYRWFSSRSWRWPFLRPLLPVLRRFL